MKARKINRVFLISGIVLFLLFLYIYWIQIEYKFGDIPSHIATALELKGYTINKYVVNFIISKANLGNFGMALFLALIGICTLIATYSLIKSIGSMCSNQVDDAVAWIISCFVPFFFSLFVPKLYPYFYANTISPNAWHNSTLIEMRLFSIISLVYFIKLYYKKEIDWKDWAAFTLSLIVGNAFKPNYMIGFAPAAGIYLLVLFMKDKSTLWKCIKIGVGILLSALPLFYQYIELYGSPQSNNSGLVIVWGGRLTQTGNPAWKIVCGLSFVIMILIYETIDLIKSKRKFDTWSGIFYFLNLMMLINFIMYCFVLERNDTGAGNTAWGLKNILYILYALDLYDLYRIYKNKPKHALILSIIPLLQLIGGVTYTILLMLKRDYYFLDIHYMRYRNKNVDTLKFLAVFIVFFTHYINRFGDQYRYVFYKLPSSILLYGVSGKMGVVILGVIMGWLAYGSKRDISEAIVHRYCFFFVSVLLINVFYNIWNCFQGTDFSFGSFVRSCLLLDDTFFPALWFIKDFFLAYIISILNKCGKIKWGGVILEIIILFLFNEVWIAVCLFGNVYALLVTNNNVRLKMILQIWWVQCFILIGAFLITKRRESFVAYILDGIACVLVLIVLNENKKLSAIFSNKLTSFVGEHSWGFFLVHALIYNIIGTQFFELDDYVGSGSYGMRFMMCFITCFVCNILLSVPLTIVIKRLALFVEKMIKTRLIASIEVRDDKCKMI